MTNLHFLSLARMVLATAMGFSLAASGIALGATEEPVVANPTTLARAERSAVDLQQGMGTEDVLRLLGSPQRTSLRSEGADLLRQSRGTLQWTYTWKDSAQHATLTVEFASKGTEGWAVKGWEWINY